MDARSALAQAFAEDLLAAWKDHGKAVLKKLADEESVNFVKIVAAQQPRDGEAEPAPAMTEEQRHNRIRELIDELGFGAGPGRAGESAAGGQAG